MEKIVHILAVGIRRGGSIWRKAGVETALLEEEWRYRRGLKSELIRMEEVRKVIYGLRTELARTVAASPWAAAVAVEILEERLAAVRDRSSRTVRNPSVTVPEGKEEQSA